MRKSLVLAMISVLLCSSMVLAGVPDPSRSGCGTAGAGTTCHFRFASDGAWDQLTLCVTLRDAFDTPVASCSTSVTLNFSGVSPRFFCSCDGTRFTGTSALDGTVYFYLSRIGGSGSLELAVTAHCTGNIGICAPAVEFTSPDLNGSCETAPTVSTGVADLGIWAIGLGGYTVYSDYDCVSGVGIADLGQWATFGLSSSCP